MEDKGNNTMIRVKKETRQRLKELGRKDDSYDTIINELLDQKEGKKE